MSVRRYLALLKDTFTAWQAHKAERIGAALAYYTIFSLAPLLVIFIGIAALAFGQETAQTQLIGQVRNLLGADGATFVQALIGSARHSGSGAAATLVGLGTLLLGAVGLFLHLQAALNTIWDVVPDPRRGIRGAVRDRLVSLGLLLGVGFLLLVSLLASAFIVTAGRYFADLLPVSPTVLEAMNLVLSFVFSTLLFAMLF